MVRKIALTAPCASILGVLLPWSTPVVASTCLPFVSGILTFVHTNVNSTSLSCEKALMQCCTAVRTSVNNTSLSFEKAP